MKELLTWVFCVVIVFVAIVIVVAAIAVPFNSTSEMITPVTTALILVPIIDLLPSSR